VQEPPDCGGTTPGESANEIDSARIQGDIVQARAWPCRKGRVFFPDYYDALYIIGKW
jgi:hypothetical protein